MFNFLNLVKPKKQLYNQDYLFYNLSPDEKIKFHRYLYLVDKKNEKWHVKKIDTLNNTIEYTVTDILEIPLCSKIRVDDVMLAESMKKNYPFVQDNWLVNSFFNL